MFAHWSVTREGSIRGNLLRKGNIAFALVLFAVELISFLKMSRLEEYVLSSFFLDKKFLFYRKVAR